MTHLFCIVLLPFLYPRLISGEDCEPNIVTTGNTWTQGQDGNLQIAIPEELLKWRVEIMYDKAATGIQAWQGKREKCFTKLKKCRFQSEKYNRKQKAGDVLNLGYQIQFDDDSVPPKVTSVKLFYCSAKPCPKWNDAGIVEYTVCPNEATTDSPTTTNMPTESPTASPTDSPTEEPTTGAPTDMPTQSPTEVPTPGPITTTGRSDISA